MGKLSGENVRQMNRSAKSLFIPSINLDGFSLVSELLPVYSFTKLSHCTVIHDGKDVTEIGHCGTLA